MLIECMSDNKHGYVDRVFESQMVRALTEVPVVVLTGPRQCGKSTLAKRVLEHGGGGCYLDLERPRDLLRLQDPERFFAEHAGELICLDEIQRTPEIFPHLRSVVDERNRNGQFLLLGSASPDVLRQSSESLAGRVRFIELTPFLWLEIHRTDRKELFGYWLRGGYPRSVQAADDDASFQWRVDYMSALLERDVPNFGFRIPPATLRRAWTMIAHYQGELINLSKIGTSLGVSHSTVRSHLDVLTRLYMTHELPPLEANIKKRLVKTPKVYVRDSGLFHALLDIGTKEELLGHPAYGSSWEGLVLEHVRATLPRWKRSFYRTTNGAELDIVLESQGRLIAVECKASSSPTVSRGFWTAISDLGIKEAWVVAPVDESYPIGEGVRVAPLHEMLATLQGGANPGASRTHKTA
jgi:uncharacterized protein